MTKITKRVSHAIIMGMMMCLMLAMTACGEREKKKVNQVLTKNVLGYCMNSVPFEDDYTCYLSDVVGWDEYARRYYQFDTDTIASITDYSVAVSTTISADEYVIIKTRNVDLVEKALNEHLKLRIGDYTGYAPDEATKLEKARVETIGNYVFLFVSDESDDVIKACKKCLTEEVEYNDDIDALVALNYQLAQENNEPATTEVVENTEGTEDATEAPLPNTMTADDGTVLIEEIPGVINVYDTSKIVEAYKTKKPSILTDEKDIAVYYECVRIIDEYITEGMSTEEKERAIHDYIINTAHYDENCLIYSTWYSQYADQPYGCLIDKRAICIGYTSTFQLFMDMLDIECLIVKGQANYDKANHAWNKIKLDDGEWYNVDVTWDDPANLDPASYDEGEDMSWLDDIETDYKHEYYNISDRQMRSTSHYWDENAYPATE